jgi:hypothetical protein
LPFAWPSAFRPSSARLPAHNFGNAELRPRQPVRPALSFPDPCDRLADYPISQSLAMSHPCGSLWLILVWDNPRSLLVPWPYRSSSREAITAQKRAQSEIWASGRRLLPYECIMRKVGAGPRLCL